MVTSYVWYGLAAGLSEQGDLKSKSVVMQVNSIVFSNRKEIENAVNFMRLQYLKMVRPGRSCRAF